MPVKVFLWTAPRCISTALERSMRELNSAKVFHEPFGDSYHFGPERISERYSHQPVDYNVSYDKMVELVTKDYDVDVVFSKDMAYMLENNFERLLSNELRQFQHTFLIRNPKQSIPGLYRASVNKELTGWDYFDGNEAGFKQMYELYCFIEEKFDVQPVVIDAVDLLMNPSGTMKAYTGATGINYDPNMLTWEPGLTKDWTFWNGWYESVSKSSGFIRRSKEKAEKCEDITLLPMEVQRSIEESMPFYMSLQKHKINPIV